MNRQKRRKLCRKYKLTEEQLYKLVEELQLEFEVASTETAMNFLSMTIEVLRESFGFGPKRIDRYTDGVNNKLESINMNYVSFKDLLAEISLKPLDIVRMSDGVRQEKLKEIEERRLAG